ncbi:signal recognition particle-docking protein FtsY [Proteiniclasticum ruminis]|jgi:fused signal recognition particle receptor|uniref:Signal recognition particle receptor FtsY n=1 Tax=Proteiniclasticum ruminis TaxID=398199 RepID=A0A1G8G389_9CLOT|nr:signal recognition particle-docking protein FtsY [Proteiniclasticum ruminis]SDH88908.1 fused signal recognition particle receptor [Proteiniclasticum ruminis]
MANFFEKLKNGLSKTRENITGKMNEVLGLAMTIDEDLFEELEEVLITSDVGYETSMELIERLRKKIRLQKVTEVEKVRDVLKEVVSEFMEDEEKIFEVKKPTILLIIGVNGVGKTTSIGKLAYKYKNEGKKVILAAADTFRAAAIDQLEVWAKRAEVDIVRHQEGSDPAAVVYDALEAFKARNADVLLCDTAGRLHNKKNLMNELEKIRRVIDREFGDANIYSLLVLDGTSGQNAVIQAKEFQKVAQLDGIILTKLDGTAKGGVVLSIKESLKIPVVYIGVGEAIEDLQDFDAKAFADALI